MVIKVADHWLYGAIEMNVKATKESKCQLCIHKIVCKDDRESFCLNYLFGTSEFKGCQSCLHRFSRWDARQPIKCFKCKYFDAGESANNGTVNP